MPAYFKRNLNIAIWSYEPHVFFKTVNRANFELKKTVLMTSSSNVIGFQFSVPRNFLCREIYLAIGVE